MNVAMLADLERERPSRRRKCQAVRQQQPPPPPFLLLTGIRNDRALATLVDPLTSQQDSACVMSAQNDARMVPREGNEADCDQLAENNRCMAKVDLCRDITWHTSILMNQSRVRLRSFLWGHCSSHIV